MPPIRRTALALAAALACWTHPAHPADDPFRTIDLPESWQRQFWDGPDARALLALEPPALARLVPPQAGLFYCSCPACNAPEEDDPLAWAAERPEILTCRRCSATFPNAAIPAQVVGKVPEEAVEVRPGVVHRYPFHAPPPARQRFPDERLYLAAKRDDAARRLLSKFALYAAIRHRGQPDPDLALRAALVILRGAQVYPLYAVHYDQPGRPKVFQPADLPPPYRRDYGSAKWDRTGALDVPLNLVIAYALLRDDPAWPEAARLLNDPDPARTIERDFFRASARFVRDQPAEPGEADLYAIRGLLAVGRLLDDPDLLRSARDRLDLLAHHGFYHDGLWRDAQPRSQRRVVNLLEGWIARLLPAESASADPLPLLALARRATGPISAAAPDADIQQAAWPARPAPAPPRGPLLLGGAAVARLSVGEGPQALDIELRGVGDDGNRPAARLALRLAVAGREVLGDLDALPPHPDGLDRATASHNTVLIDGLNQRETPALAARPTPGADVLFYAADPDFQVAWLADPRAYPISATKYRHLLIASSGPGGPYAVGVAEIEGGLRHDQLFQAAPALPARWQIPGPLAPGPESLLAPNIRYLSTARAADGRWFVQALGALTDLRSRRLDAPTAATLAGPGPGLRLHILGDAPATVCLAGAPGPLPEGRAALVLRRDSPAGSTLASRFVTVFEPTTANHPPAARIGRVESPPGTVLLLIATPQGDDHLLINLEPGTERTARLPDGRLLTTDGLAVRVRGADLVLAGGRSARLGDHRLENPPIRGTIRSTERDERGRGIFLTAGPLPAEPSDLAGRALVIHHADGTRRAWTIAAVEPTPSAARIQVREAPGFHIDPATGEARYDHLPGTRHPGPHAFRIDRLAR